MPDDRSNGTRGGDAALARILVVDDNPTNLLTMSAILAPTGHTVVTARSGHEALRAMIHGDFAVVLLDVNMPVMDGFEVATMIRGRDRTARTPIIFVTAYSETASLVERGYALGAVDYIFSPVVPSILRSKVEVFVELHNQRQELQRRGDVLERMLESLTARLEVGVFTVDPSGRLKCLNDACARLLGVASSRGSDAGTPVATLIPDFERCVDEARTVGGGVLRCELCLQRPEGELWVLLSLSVDPAGRSAPGHVHGMIEDISARKKVERDLTRTNTELTQLRDQLEHRTTDLSLANQALEVLVKEVHHRVKNNLQVISSLLNLQAMHLRDPSAKEVFLDSQCRVQSIALVHEKLHQSQDVSHVNFDEYVRVLVESLFHTHDGRRRGIRPVIDGGSLQLSVDVAIPCGLIVNELVTNALKHAFPGGREGSVHVALRQAKPNTVELLVEDDGIGLPSDFDPRKTSSLGLDLVFTFAKQLDAEVDARRENGTRFSLRFAGGE